MTLRLIMLVKKEQRMRWARHIRRYDWQACRGHVLQPPPSPPLTTLARRKFATLVLQDKIFVQICTSVCPVTSRHIRKCLSPVAIKQISYQCSFFFKFAGWCAAAVHHSWEAIIAVVGDKSIQQRTKYSDSKLQRFYNKGGDSLRITARAIAIRCFWPPLSMRPRSPTFVLYLHKQDADKQSTKP